MLVQAQAATSTLDLDLHQAPGFSIRSARLPMSPRPRMATNQPSLAWQARDSQRAGMPDSAAYARSHLARQAAKSSWSRALRVVHAAAARCHQRSRPAGGLQGSRTPHAMACGCLRCASGVQAHCSLEGESLLASTCGGELACQGTMQDLWDQDLGNGLRSPSAC